MLRKLKLSQWYGKNYDEFAILKKYITVMKTGKSAKKSSTIAKKIVLRSVFQKDFSVVVAKKTMLDHEKTTFAAIIKAFERFEKLTGYKWKNEWVVSKGAKNPNITNTKTGQVFRFVSYDRPESIAGLETESDNLFYQFIWFEEPMQISDKNISEKESQKQQKQEEQDFDIMVSSAFRGIIPKTAHREICFSFNHWSKGDHWLINRYVKPFIAESSDILDSKGKQVHYDPNFQDGKGILVMVATGGINEFNDEDYLKFIREIKQNDYEFYKAIWLGTAANVTGNAYGAPNIKKINYSVDRNKIKQWSIGIDYSSTKDFTCMYLVGTTDDKEIHIFDCFRYHRGKAKKPLAEPELVELMWVKIEEWTKSYDFASSEYKVKIKIDSRDSLLRSYLEKHYYEASSIIQYDLDIPSPASKFKSASSFVRVMAFRQMLGSGKVFIDPNLTDLVENIKTREIYKDGSMKDGGDDDIQAVEYAISYKLAYLLPDYAYKSILQAYVDIKVTNSEGESDE